MPLYKNNYRPGGDDVALADGGTGASLSDPNADRILFWDDSAGATTWLTAGSGLSISGTSITASSTVPGFYTYLAASLEPLAIEPRQKGAYSYAVASNETKLVVNAWNTRLGSSGRWEIRDPKHPLMALRGVTVTGLAADSTGVFLNPSLATYTDARTTYFNRLQTIYETANNYIALSSPSTRYPFLPGPYGSIITSVNVFDYDWVIIRFYESTLGWNLTNEIGDSAANDYQRQAHRSFIPVSKYVASTFETSAEKSAGAGEGSVTWINCPSSWGAVTDSTTYDFRDDFMGTSLDTTNTWTRAQSTVGNVEINNLYNWVKMTGNVNWGDNGLFGQSSIARANGKVFMMDVWSPSANLDGFIVGAHDGTGQSYSDFSHGLDFTNNGGGSAQLQVFENGNSRGAVGSGYSADTIYRVRITIGASNNATYAIQGGSQYGAIGSASWTDITPATSSSSTTPLHIGASCKNVTGVYFGDPKIY